MKQFASASLCVLSACTLLVLRATGQSTEDGAKKIQFRDAVKIFNHPKKASTTKSEAPAPTPSRGQPAQQLGFKYQIRLTRDNRVEMVEPAFHFTNGDIIHLVCNLNEESYIYILQRTFFDPSASDKGMVATKAGVRAPTPYKLLYPLGEAHMLPAGKDQTIPDDVTMKMDNEPGTEKLYIVISKAPLDLARLVKSQPDIDQSKTDDDTAQLTRLLMNFRDNTQISESDHHAMGFDAEKNYSAPPIGFALTKDPVKPFVAVVTLQHFASESR